MVNNNDLMKRMNSKYSSMSKGQKLLANYITDYYDKAAFLTAARLGEVVGVSESTVVRFAMSLGYKGYPEFQRDLAGQVQNRLVQSQEPQVKPGRMHQSEVLKTVLDADAARIRSTLEEIDESAFNSAVEMITKARNIYIIGLRSCEPLANFLGFYLRMMVDHVVILSTNSPNEIFEQMYHISDKDLIIGISFPRYSMRTLKALEFANNRNAKVVTITDSIHSPMNLYSSCNLIAKSDMISIADSLVAPMSVINAIIVALSKNRRRAVAENLTELEQIWSDYSVDGNDEIEPITDAIRMHYAKESEL